VDPDGRGVADGGRVRRALDRFRMTLPEAGELSLVMRVGAEGPTAVSVKVGGVEVETVPVLAAGAWIERRLRLPRETARGVTTVEVRPVPSEESDGRFASFHYWLFADP
jgi:hypothetical protein